LITSSLRIALLASIIINIVGLVAAKMVGDIGMHIGFPSILLIMGYTVCTGICHILAQYLNAIRNRIGHGLIISSLACMQYALCAISFHILGKTVLSISFAYFLSSLVVAITALACIYLMLLRNSNTYSIKLTDESAMKSWNSAIFDFGIYFSRWGMFTLTFIVSDRWSLQVFCGNTTVGIYGLAYQLGYAPVAIISGLIMQFITPLLFHEVSSHEETHMLSSKGKSIITISIVACITLSVTFALLSPLFISIITPDSYREASIVAMFLACAAGTCSSAEIIGLAYQAEHRLKYLSKVKIISSIMGITTNVIMAKIWGAHGVASYAIIWGIPIFLAIF
jgi:O-antigen/teichoic acid export membrane protein